MWSIELACLLAGISSKFTNQILVDETKHIIVLLSVHRYVFYQVQQTFDGSRLILGGRPQFLQANFKSIKDVFENILMGRMYKTFKSR